MEARTYRRIVVAQRGGPEVMKVVEEPVPDPKQGEVRIRMLAAGVSALDLMVRRSSFPGFPKLPFTPGVDVVGIVDAIGEGVSHIETGQRVAALLGYAGGYAELVCLPASVVVPLPPHLDPAEAVCIVANYLTAHTMLHRAAHVRSGERILVQGAAGGVGSALLELGALAGLEMYGTASPHNHELVASLGAKPIDYHTEDFVARIRQLTGDGVDAVFDPIGGARQLWRSYRALKPGGRLVWFGVAGTKEHGVKVIPLSLLTRLLVALIPDGKNAPLAPDSSKPNEEYRTTLASLLDLLAAGQLHPVVAERFPLLEASRAHELMERGHYSGKVVLTTDEPAPDG